MAEKPRRVWTALKLAGWCGGLAACFLTGMYLGAGLARLRLAAGPEDGVEAPPPAQEAPAPEPVRPAVLESVELPGDMQQEILQVCGGDEELFCLVLAIAKVESNFTADAVSSTGQCLGMMQINAARHTGRTKRLGVTDLFDPVQCAATAVDILRELEAVYGLEPYSHALVMAYNMGPAGASQLGAGSTGYSRAVLNTYQTYREELSRTH